MMGEIYQGECFMYVKDIFKALIAVPKYSTLTFTSNSLLSKLKDHLGVWWSYDFLEYLIYLGNLGKLNLDPLNYKQGYQKET